MTEAQPEEESERITNEILDNLKNSKFKQQKLPGWRPVPTELSTGFIFSIIGVIFIIFGIVLLVTSSKIVEIKERYDDKCTINSTCSIEIFVNKEMKPPIMFYYQLDNFYQNHRMYVKSFSKEQLKGESFTVKEMEKDGGCDPVITNKEMDRTVSVDNTTLDPNALAIPCGLIAKSFFNDTFTLKYGSKEIEIDESNIAWKSDKKRYKNTDRDWEKVQWIDMTDEHLMVWMRPAGLEGFRKLWGRVRKTLLGTYTITIENNYDVSAFEGKKYIVLSTANKFGGKNTFLGYSYIVVGALAILSVLAYLLYTKYSKGKKKKNE